MEATQTTMIERNADRLDPREEIFRIAGPVAGLRLGLRYLPPLPHPADASKAGASRVVLYVHGGTFPSALSVAHRFDGRSWRDALCDAGFACWGARLLRLRGAVRPLSRRWPSRPKATSRSAAPRAPAGSSRRRSASSAATTASSASRSSRIPGAASSPDASPGAAPSSSTAWCCSARSPGGPRSAEPTRLPAWRLISLADQWNRFVADVPEGEKPVLLRRHFDDWGERYLDGDRDSRTRSPGSGQGAERPVPGHLRRLGRFARLRSGADPRARWRSSAANGTAWHRRRFALAARCHDRGAAAARHQDRPRDPSHASRGEPLRALS